MRDDEAGTSSAIAFALAGVLFIAAISTVLVYANDRIPPPTKSRPFDELSAEARVLLHSFVLGPGEAVWDDTTHWTVVTGELPGLRDCSGPCSGPIVLSRERIEALHAGDIEGTPTPAGSYAYETLRGPDYLGLSALGRAFRITVDDVSDSPPAATADCPGLGCLMDYGEPLTDRTATRPAVAFVELDDGTPVRVSVHVFLLCDEGACLDA